MVQPDEEPTIRLNGENTPSAVLITNLATKQDASTLDVWEEPQRYGSGVVWDKNGLIVTNYHVIRGYNKLRVTLFDQSHQTTYEAKLVGFDEHKDVAVLRIHAPEDKLRPITVGVSSDLRAGQKVFAIGYAPLGLAPALKTGTLSGFQPANIYRATAQPGEYYIQIDGHLNPGDSGGPLLDSSGSLIGINTWIWSPTGASCGVGFAVPVDTVKGVVDKLVKNCKVMRPTLGIDFESDESLEKIGVSGLLILDVAPDGPAGKAGLKPIKWVNERLILGDIITSVNGEEVTSGSDYDRIIDNCKVGEEVIVEVLRGVHKEKIPVIPEPKPDES